MAETTAHRLKEIMERKGLKQVDILRLAKPYCERYNVALGKSDLSQFVNGKVVPGQQKLTILGLVLNVSEAWLMGLDVPMQRGTTTCPICGLLYADDFEPDVIEHKQVHEKFLAARNYFGICYSPLEFERIKRTVCPIVNSYQYETGKKYTIDEKIDATTKLLKVYFSQSVWANDCSLSHPTFDQYVSMLLNQKYWETSIEQEVYNSLVYRYGKSPGIPEGNTKYKISQSTLDYKGNGFLKEDEKSLVDIYRCLNDQGQEYIRQTLYIASQTYKRK